MLECPKCGAIAAWEPDWSSRASRRADRGGRRS